MNNQRIYNWLGGEMISTDAWYRHPLFRRRIFPVFNLERQEIQELRLFGRYFDTTFVAETRQVWRVLDGVSSRGRREEEFKADGRGYFG
ncbi:MAG: hypothetical protein NTW21_13960 [Verrucomicrobia bacterium]|nr:hypothetical protein [Verrucomicrobiota bacterium]